MSTLQLAPRPELARPPTALWIADIAVASLVALMCLTGGVGWSLLGDVLLAGGLALRTHRPPFATALATAGGLVLLVTADVPTFGLVAVPIITYATARWAGRKTQWVTIAILALASASGPARWFIGQAYNNNVTVVLVMTFTCVVTVAAAYAFGLVVRAMMTNRTTRAFARHEQERHLMAQREQELRFNAAAERARIARELHDIVAHSLAVIVVQAEGAKAIAARKPEMAVQTLDTIADASRQSLAEMRRMVRLLRGEEGDAADYVPTAGLADLGDLVERTGNATLAVHGQPAPMSPAVELAAYRIVQESLTNVIKHGGPNARAEVIITHHQHAIDLVIADNGRGAAAVSDGMGSGIRGMAERLQLHGGTLKTGPRGGGGFVVRAHLPTAGSEPHPQGDLR